MKKLTYLLGVLLLCSVLSISLLKAQIGSGTNHFVIEDLGDPGFSEPCIPLDELCRTNILFFTAHTAHYDQYNWSDNGNSLPPWANPQAPTMYVRYSIGAYYQSTEIPLDDFEEEEPDFFAMRVSMGQFGAVLDCQESEGGILSVEVKLELLAKNSPTTFIPYPMSSFSEPGQLFACDKFDHGPCPDPVPSTFEEVIKICCDDCGLYIGLPRSNGENTEDELQINTALWSVQPNPFNNDLMVKYSLSTESAVNIQLFNLNGQQVLTNNQMQQRGDHQTRINTANLPNGIYHCQINTIDGVVTKKIIKMD